MPDGEVLKESMRFGEIKRIPLPERAEARVVIKPRGLFDVGMGEGKELETILQGGVVGIVLDARGRPLLLPQDKEKRNKMFIKWWNALDLYPMDF